jgi:NADH-quinone oxidoreductase subunit M
LAAILLPLAGALLLCLMGKTGAAAARQSALVTSLITLAVVSLVVWKFRGHAGDYKELNFPWFDAYCVRVNLSFGLDGLSIWLFGLSALLVVTCVLVSWQAIQDRAAAFYALLLLLESGMLGVFAAKDLLLFYIFFEFTLIPLFFLIGIWGSEDRRHAAIKFFLFTLAGSMLTFVGMLSIVIWCGQFQPGQLLNFSIPELTKTLAAHPIPLPQQIWIFLALFIGFAIKVPLFPLHTWLPLAHVQAPTAGSVLLAGILLKLGTYGFVRFNLPMLPQATAVCAPYILVLATAGIIYGALVALAQKDIKRLIAYSSVSHLGFCMLGMFALNRLGLQGSVLQMINHGLSTGGLFAIVGMIYERYHTRQIDAYSGLAKRLPRLAVFLLLFTFSSIGLPGMNGFVGEVMILVGMFQAAWQDAPLGWQTAYSAMAVISVFGVVLGAWYMLWLVQRTFFGPLHEPHSHNHDHGHAHEPVQDMNGREILALLPLVVFIFWIGLVPRHFLKSISDVNEVVLAAPHADVAAEPALFAARPAENLPLASTLAP